VRKLIYIFCISILSFVETGYSQPDSVLSYMTLNIGNQWQYQVHYVVNNSNIDTIYYSLYTVESDTIMPNGYQYQVIETDSETKYVHIDSSTSCVYEYEFNSSHGFMTDSLRCSEGDYFGMNNYCELIDTTSILNYKTWIMLIDRTAPDISERHTLALDIGISHKETITTYGYGTTKTSTLVYANINGTEFGELVTSADDLSNEINSYNLHQNYPNPFNPSTIIKFRISEFGIVNFKVYDVLGNEVATLVEEEKPAGEYEVEFNGDGLTSGIYFYQLKFRDFIQTKKMILLK